MHAVPFSFGCGDVSRSEVGIGVIGTIERARHNFDGLLKASSMNMLLTADVAPSPPNRSGHHLGSSHANAAA
jgi:hypothetical protein